MDALKNDLRLALRGLRRTPGFTAAAVLTLALGIGATTALFSVVHAVLLRSLGWGEESRLVAIHTNYAAQGLKGLWISAPEYEDLKRASFFSSVGISADRTAAVQGERAESVHIGYSSGSFFKTLGIAPIFGRVFEDREDLQGNDGVAILSYAAFVKRYAGDAKVVGSSVTIGGTPRTIVGVLPETFRWEVPNEFWIPFGFRPHEIAEERGNHRIDAVGRLAAGMTSASADSAMAAFSRDLVQAHPDYYPASSRFSMSLEPLRDRFVGSARAPLYLLFGAVLLVLLIACGNVANLLLARGAARSREMAVRSALGAGRRRLVRQLLTESALLAVAGTAIGIVIASWSLSVLLSAAPEAVRALTDLSLDKNVLLFAAALSLATTLVFGLLPALQSSRADVRSALQAFPGPHAGRLRAALVVLQVALSLMLLAGAGLMLRSFERLLSVPAGFDATNVVAARVALGGPSYAKDEAQAAFWAEALRRVQAIPGVVAAGAVNMPPLEGHTDWSYTVEGYTIRPGDPGLDDELRRVTPGYFAALRIPILRGRDLTTSDDAQAPPVMMVNDAWVRRFFPGQDVLGKRIQIGGNKTPFRTVVGVAGDAHDKGLDQPTPPVLYAPEAQMPDDDMTMMVRGASGAPVDAVREALASVDVTQPVEFAQPYRARIATALSSRRFPLELFGAFAFLAVALCAVGIYGVTAYGVTQRTREIGVRIAVGATRREVVWMVLRSAARLAAFGVAIGLCAALAMARLLESQLFGVSARDPLTYGSISLLLGALAVGASFLPALRAARTDPMTALRSE